MPSLTWAAWWQHVEIDPSAALLFIAFDPVVGTTILDAL
jgi:hypothetical protein